MSGEGNVGTIWGVWAPFYGDLRSSLRLKSLKGESPNEGLSTP